MENYFVLCYSKSIFSLPSSQTKKKYLSIHASYLPWNFSHVKKYTKINLNKWTGAETMNVTFVYGETISFQAFGD